MNDKVVSEYHFMLKYSFNKYKTKDFDEDDAKTIHVKLIAWGNRIKQRKAFRKWYKQRIHACSMAF